MLKDNKFATLEDRFTAFCTYVEKITGRNVIKARRGTNVQCKSPFISIDLIDCQRVPKEYSKWEFKEDGSGTQTMRGLVRIWFLVRAIGGKDYLDCLHRLHLSLSCDDYLVFQHENEMGLSEVEGVSNVSETFLDSRFDSRSEMKVCFYTPIRLSFDVLSFDHGNVSVKADDKKEDNGFDYGQSDE